MLCIWAMCLTAAGADPELPEILKDYGNEVLVPGREEKGILNPELSALGLRDRQVPVFAEGEEEGSRLQDVPEIRAEDLMPEVREDQSLPPLPVLGYSLADEPPAASSEGESSGKVRKKDSYVVISKPDPVTVPDKKLQEAISDATITVIGGRHLIATEDGTLKNRVTVVREPDYEQFYSYSFAFNDLDPALLDRLKYAALDLALEYKTRDADLNELTSRLNQLLDQYGFLFARASIEQDPRPSGSQLVLINMRGARLNRVIINNHSDLSTETVSHDLSALKSGLYLTKKAVELPLISFSQKHGLNATWKFQASGIMGKADLIIEIPERKAR